MFEITDEIEKKWLGATEAFNLGDKKLALKLFKEIADEGCEYAYTEIANIYELGGNNVEKDIEKAKRWYKKAAYDARDEDAYLALARIAYLGLDGDINYGKAFQYYSEESLNDNPIACLRIGVMFHLGEGVGKDFSKAEIHYLKSIKMGNIIAIDYISRLYFDNGRYIKAVIYRMFALLSSLFILISFNKRSSLKKW